MIHKFHFVVSGQHAGLGNRHCSNFKILFDLKGQIRKPSLNQFIYFLEVRCPVIHTDGTVTALGNTVEGAYGDVIHFQCVSSDKSLYGSNIIHCMENGNWSGPVPQCIGLYHSNILLYSNHIS